MEYIWVGGKVNRYRDVATGRWVSQRRVWEISSAAMESTMDGMGDLARQLAAHEIPLQEWQQHMRDVILTEIARQYTLARGGQSQMTAADFGSIGGMAADQYRYLDGFAARIAAGEHTEAQIAAISRMYIRSARESYERANMRAHGVLRLPTYPGAGDSACRCVISPEAPVLTRSGYKPLVDVQIGEEVLTHKLRWRKVTRVIMKPAQSYHRLAIVNGVAVTDNHLWYTQAGWKNANDIDNSSIPIYSIPNNLEWEEDHENMPEVWWHYGEPSYLPYMQSVQIGVSLRELQGSSRQGVQLLRKLHKGQVAVGKKRRLIPQGRQATKILFPTLPRSLAEEKVAVFDLEVAEDHSFCVNGVFAHNTNCRCRWEIHMLDDRVEAYWRLNPAAETCEDCVDFSQRWAPYVVPEQDLAK
jgi:hypothetical protein